MCKAKIVLSIVLVSTLLAIAVRATTQSDPGVLEDGARGISGEKLWMSPEIAKVRQELERATEEEIQSGCTENTFSGQVLFCGKSKDRIDRLEANLSEAIRLYHLRDSVEVKNGLEAVKSLTLSAGLDVQFDGSSANPFAKNGSKVNFYVDSSGVDYWVNPKNNQVVNIDFSKSKMRLIEPSSRRSKADLEAIAEGFLGDHVARFAKDKNSLQVRVLDCRSDDLVCTFRWEGAPSSKDEMSRFIQVSVSVDGRIVGFTNTQNM